MNTPIQNVNLGRPCSAKYDRLRREDYETAQEFIYERALVQAKEEFADGELDDEIRDLVADEPLDATAIALAYMFPREILWNACAGKDFVATVEGVIERRAQLIMEEL